MTERKHDDYVLTDDDGTTWLFVAEHERSYNRRGEVLIDGEPAEATRMPGWFRAPRWPAEVTIQPPTMTKISHYVLADATLRSDTFPAELTPEQYRERTNDIDGETVEGAIERRIYEAVRVEGDKPEPIVVGPFVSLNGPPPEPDPLGRTYTVHVPDSLRYTPAVFHLLPGALIGFKAAARDQIKGMNGCDCYDNGGAHAPLTIYRRVMLARDKPVWEKRGRDKRKREYHTSLVTRRLELPVADSVQGTNRADAEAKWDERMAGVVAQVDAMLAATCPTCHGAGVIAAGEESLA